MDLLCDNMVEEILVRLPEERHLRRAGAICRRYNAIISRPGFAARHRETHSPLLSGGVVLHDMLRYCPRVDNTARHVRGSYAFFLAASASSSSSSSTAASSLDLASLLPSLTDRELAYLLSTGADPEAAGRSIFIVHSSSGLLLCCRGYVNPVHYYVCDPVARRCVALPELPWPPACEKSGMLSVAAGDGDDGAEKRFQVVLFEQRRKWDRPGGYLHLEVFSSDSGEWTAMRLPHPPDLVGFQCFTPPYLRHDGTAAYWLGFDPRDRAVAYSSVNHSIRLIPVAGRVDDPSALNRFVGERRHRGGVLRYSHFDAEEFEVWDTQPGDDGTTPPRWTLVHRASLKDVVARSPRSVATAFIHRHIVGHIHRYVAGRAASIPDEILYSFFALIGFDPVDDDVFFFGATNGNGCVAAYSMRLGRLSHRCKIDNGGLSVCSCDMFPYARPPRPMRIPGMQRLD